MDRLVALGIGGFNSRVFFNAMYDDIKSHAEPVLSCCIPEKG